MFSVETVFIDVFFDSKGFLVSLWLNFGASKLQFYQLFHKSRVERNAVAAASSRIAEEGEWDASPPMDSPEEQPLERPSGDETNVDLLYFVPQEADFFRMMCAWAVLASSSWFLSNETATTLCGWAVNVNLVFFYGAPLNTIRSVVRTHDSSAIHRPTLTMSLINTSFWMLYGLARTNAVIVAPNATGFLLGLAQSVLCLYFPAKKVNTGSENESGAPSSIHDMTPQPISQDVDDFV